MKKPSNMDSDELKQELKYCHKKINSEQIAHGIDDMRRMKHLEQEAESRGWDITIKPVMYINRNR